MQGDAQVKCTVLGGGGFIGRSLVRHLEAEGCKVWVPERDDRTVFEKPLGHVFYCIGLTADFRSRPFDTVRAHVSLLSEILQKEAFDSLLYLSSTRVYGRSENTSEEGALPVLPADPSDLYNISKLMGESLCLSSAKNGVRIVRLSNVVGSAMGLDNLVGHLFQEARAGKIRLRTHPASVKDYIFIDDAVRMLGRIGLGGRERIYNVASGEQMEHRQWLTALSGFTGCIVEVDQNAPLQSFPAINVERMKREFGFKPTPISEVVQLLLMNLNTFG